MEQNHIVHVAYQTSGINDGDEEAIRYLSLMINILERFDPTDKVLKSKYETMRDFLTKKKSGDKDTSDILYLKGRIRRKKHFAYVLHNEFSWKVHFLDLPFETGKN